MRSSICIHARKRLDIEMSFKSINSKCRKQKSIRNGLDYGVTYIIVVSWDGNIMLGSMKKNMSHINCPIPIPLPSLYLLLVNEY